MEGEGLAKEVRAVREIQAGQEMTANYIDSYEATFSSSDERQFRLEHWNFVCKCEVCGLRGEARKKNDQVRRNIGLQHQLIPRYMEGWNVERAVQAARTKVDLMLSVRREMETTLPSALLELWEMSRIGQEQGLTVKEGDCKKLLEEAEELANRWEIELIDLQLCCRLGDRFLHVHREKVEQVETTVKELVKRKRQDTANTLSSTRIHGYKTVKNY